MKKPAMLLILLCFLTSCPFVVSKINYYIDNKSNDAIIVYFGSGGVNSPIYPDTTLYHICADKVRHSK